MNPCRENDAIRFVQRGLFQRLRSEKSHWEQMNREYMKFEVILLDKLHPIHGWLIHGNLIHGKLMGINE